MKKKIMTLAAALCAVAAAGAQESATRYMNIHLKSGEVQKVALNEIDSLTFGASAAMSDVTFDMDITETAGTWVTYRITPSESSAVYFHDILLKEKYNTEKESHDGNIWGFDKAWYEWMADMYGDKPWYDYMLSFASTGPIEETTDPYEMLMRWNTEYVMYCYAVAEDGTQTSAVAEKEFKTAEPQPSANVITAEVSNITSKSADINITTTNDDQYFVTAQKKSTVDRFDSDDDLVYSLMETLYSSPIYFKNGDFSGNEGFSYLSADTDYVLLVFGFDEGPTTAVQKITFHTLPKE